VQQNDGVKQLSLMGFAYSADSDEKMGSKVKECHEIVNKQQINNRIDKS